jgi:hypothetical protein
LIGWSRRWSIVEINLEMEKYGIPRKSDKTQN